ncbi:actin-like protein 10 [Tyto alba]|uniref:actin-like protein 10 n=1 Tax=Tyto alba TaxID=56313 RepID=UPI001C667F39|nr:actin-like protein 10 [Tyto alba]
MPEPAAITDTTSSFTQAGFAGQKQPKFVPRTVLLHCCSAGTVWESQQQPATAESTAGFTLAPRTYPLKHSIVEDCKGMENLWRHLFFFCGLKALPEEQPALTADTLSRPSTNREKGAEVLFQSFRVPALHMANTGGSSPSVPMAVTGLAVEAGAGVSHVTSICLGRTRREGTYCLGVPGGFLSSPLPRLLTESPNHPSVLKALKKTVILLTKQCRYTSMDYGGDLHGPGYHQPARFQVPDGHWITLDKEQFCCLEPLFQSKLLHQSSPGLHHLALKSLQKVPDRARRDTVGNIVLSGGSSMFPGFPEARLELNSLFHSTGHHTEVQASPQRGAAAWAGGSMAASLTSFQHVWVAKGEYQEHGAEYVQKIFLWADESCAVKASPRRGTAPAAGGGSETPPCSAQSCGGSGDPGPAPVLLRGGQVNSNTPKEVNCFTFTPRVTSVPIYHHPNKDVPDQAGNTTAGRAVNSGPVWVQLVDS